MIVFARPLLERSREPLKLLGQFLGLRFLLGRLAHRSGLHLHDDGLVPRSGLDGQLARQEKIAPISFGNLHHIAARSQLAYIFFENDFHDMTPILRLIAALACHPEHSEGSWFFAPTAKTRIPRFARNDKSFMDFLRCSSGKRQQCDVACLLDGRGQPVLMRRTHAGQPPGHDLAALRHELPEQTVIFVVDVGNLLGAELANLLAPEKLSPTFTRRTAGPGSPTTPAETRTVSRRPELARSIASRPLR